MRNITPQMRQLYERLEAAGFKRKYVRDNALASWWKDEDAANPRLFARAEREITRFLGLDLERLRAGEIAGAYQVKPCFKKRANTDQAKLNAATFVALRALEIAARAVAAPPQKLPTSASELRSLLLQRSDVVDLKALLDWCLSAGIIVLHLPNLPAPKFDGLAALVPNGEQEGERRGAIALSQNCKSEGKLLFHLAHELAHLALGHVTDEQPRCDETIDGGGDAIEQEANRWAVELLTGDANYRVVNVVIDANRLVVVAREVGREQRIAPAVVALNWGWNYGRHGATTEALKVLEPNSDAPKMVWRVLKSHLDLESVSEANLDYLARLSGHGELCDVREAVAA